MPFDSLGLPPTLIQALAARSIDTPLPVQAAAVPVLLSGASAMVVSRTGSGKTLAYLLPILSTLDARRPQVQAVILAPTHELAMQILRVAAGLARDMNPDLRLLPLIGGVAVGRQIDGLKKKPHLVVGSAGRVVHLLELGKLKLRDLGWLVLDEADRLLTEEGLDHVRTIAARGQARQSVFVSASEGPAATRVARELAPGLAFVRIQDGMSPEVRHCYLVCEDRDKIDWLRRVLRGLNPGRALVFVHRGAGADRAAEKLGHHQLAVADLHGARDKFARQAAMENFRAGRAAVLIASDIAARGLDVAGVELVVNLDPPSQSRDYLHRAGRTGRAGKPGLVLSLLTPAEIRLARRYAQDLRIAVEEVRLVRGELLPVTEPTRELPRRPAPRDPGKTTPRPAPDTSSRAGSRPDSAPARKPRKSTTPRQRG